MTASTSADVRAELEQLEQLEPSLRTDPLEQLLPRAEQLGDPLLEADVRIALLSALEFSGRPTEQLLPHFGWLVQAFDDRPAWWSADHDRTVLWTYKWMISHCRNDHRVPLHVVDDMLAGMEERYRRQGRGLAPVLSSRYQVESFVHGPEVAEPAYQAWREAPRTDLSDCAACEPAQSARHLAALGLHERAISEAHPVLAGDLTCMSEPQSIAADVLASLLLADRAQDAAFWHVRAARISRTQPYETGSMATHVEVAARAGQLGRGLELLEERVTDLAAPRHPRDALDLAVAGVVCLDRLLGAGHTDLEVRAPDGVRRPISELRAALAATAEEHAAAFDARNGTDRVGAWVRARIAAPDLPRLPLGPASAPTVEALSALTGAEPSRQPDPDSSADEEAALPLMDLWQAHEAAQRRGDSDAGDRIGSAWAARNATDAAWEGLLADHAAAPERALAVLDLTRSALRAAQEPDERLDLLARRGREFARQASGELEEVMIGLSADVARPSILAAHRQDEEAGDADPAPGPRVRTIIERALASIERVDALVAAGERQLDPSVSPRALARGRATGLPLDPGQRGVLLGEVLQLTSDVTPDSPFGDRWQRAAALVGTSFNQQYGDAEACHEALRLIRPDELAQLRAGAHCQLALVAISHEQPDEAADQLERAWELVAPLGGPVTLASVIEHTGRFAPRLDRARARALLERQLETAARCSRLLAAATAPRICELHLAAGSALDAAELAERWLEVARQAPDEPQAPVNREAILVDLLEQAARASLALGENGRAARTAAEARDLWSEREGWMRAAELGNLVGQAHEYSDDAVAALDAYRQAAALADRVLEAGSFAGLGVSAHNRRAAAGVALAADGLPTALAAYDEAAGVLADHRARVDRTDPADEAFAGIDPEALRRGLTWEHHYLRLSRGNALLRGGDAAGAVDQIEGLDADFAALDAWDDAVTTLHLRAGCLAQAGERRAAGRAFQRAATEAETHGLRDLRVRVASGWARWLDDEGKGEEAEKVWDRWGPAAGGA